MIGRNKEQQQFKINHQLEDWTFIPVGAIYCENIVVSQYEKKTDMKRKATRLDYY